MRQRADCTSTNGLVAPRRVRTQIRTAQLGSIPSTGLGTIAAAWGKPEFTSCRSDLSMHLREHAYGGRNHSWLSGWLNGAALRPRKSPEPARVAPRLVVPAVWPRA